MRARTTLTVVLALLPACTPLHAADDVTVRAGEDRVVILGGKTYLTGELSTSPEKDAPPTPVAWSKASGPGKVTFADAREPVTTAQFSKPGDYVLKLTAGKGAPRQSSTLAVKVVAPPPGTPLKSVETKHHKINSPLWSARAKALITGWVPHCVSKMNDPKLREGGILNFANAGRKLAGKPHGKHIGSPASDAWVHNVLESLCLAQMVDPQGDKEIIKAQESLKATMEDWISKILSAQRPDGHLNTWFTLRGEKHWTRGHEGYAAGYFLDAACAHYLLTGGKDTRLFDAARKMADCWCKNIGPPPKKAWFDGHQAMEMALVRFGRLVNRTEGKDPFDKAQGRKGDKYIALAKFLLDCRKGGGRHIQAHVPVIRQYEAVGHAVRATYSYAGMAGVAMETGDVDYQSAVASIWNNLVHRKYYITGGVGSAVGSAEGFGPDYVLPQGAYCEACSSCGELFFQHQMSMMFHDARYADLYEETLYNALLGSVDLKGTGFYYRNQLVTIYARYPWHGCPCCVGNIPRALLQLPTWMYTTSGDGIYVNLFIGSTVTVENVAGTDVEMVQVTDYPWKPKVSITVNPAAEKEFSVRIRAPNRSVSDLYAETPRADGITAIALNGSAITPPVKKGYAVIRRSWKAGDRIDLVLPMKVQRVKGIDKIAATRGQVALRYGPLIYSVESVDQDLDNVLDPNSALRTQWRGDLLGGVTVIRGTWADGSPLIAIPYYARNNRTVDASGDRRDVRSRVWLKDR